MKSSEAVESFVEEPHDAVVGPNLGVIVNLTDRRSASARRATGEAVCWGANTNGQLGDDGVSGFWSSTPVGPLL